MRQLFALPTTHFDYKYKRGNRKSSWGNYYEDQDKLKIAADISIVASGHMLDVMCFFVREFGDLSITIRSRFPSI